MAQIPAAAVRDTSVLHACCVAALQLFAALDLRMYRFRCTSMRTYVLNQTSIDDEAILM